MTQANSTALRDTSWQQLVNVAYWRLFVNAALTVCDMAAFVLASVIVLMVRNEAALYSARFHFHISLAVYVVVCALIWALCMHSVGVYHRHVMGDGYQLNLLLFKGAVLAGIMVCAAAARVGRGQARPGARGDIQGAAPRDRRARLRAGRRGELQAPVPGRDQRVRATERDLHHEHRVRWLGTRVRRSEHGHRDSGQDGASRQDDQVRGRVVQAHPRPDGIEAKQ